MDSLYMILCNNLIIYREEEIMNIKLYKGTRFLLCAMCIALIAACPMPEPEPTVPGTIGAPDLKAGNGQLTVNWTAPNNGGSEITTYHLHHSTDGGTTWSEIIVLAAPAASYTIMDLRNAAEYHVQARAVNAVGAGTWSESAVETLPAVATPSATVPDAPAAPTLEPGNRHLIVAWAAPDDGGSEITTYHLHHSADGGTTWSEIIVLAAPAASYTIRGLRNGTPYEVQARAVNNEGAGMWSEIATETPLVVAAQQTPGGTAASLSLSAANTAIIASENLTVKLTTAEPGTLAANERSGTITVTPATAPDGVSIPTVDSSSGVITVTTSTTAGTYLVYGETGSGDILFAEYLSVTVSPTTNAQLKTAVNTGISNWGDTADLNYIITTAVTDMSTVFKNNTTFNGDISLWDTTAVTDMNNMFYLTILFDGDISGWDTGAVTNMMHTFYSAASFNGDISGWDVSSVTNMSWMFNAAGIFNIDISGWDVSKVTNMHWMFQSASAFNVDLEEWKEHWTSETGNKLNASGKYTGNKTDMFQGSGVTGDLIPSWL